MTEPTLAEVLRGPPEPTPAKPNRTAGKTLAGIVGVLCATALFTAIPNVESGRTVAVKIDAAGHPTIRNISGKQYLRSYLDIIGVVTACDGIATKDIKLGQVRTEAECTALLERELIRTASGVMACTPGLALTVPGADGPRFAAVSLAYNIGTGAYCKSTAAKRFNLGAFPSGCDAIKLFNKAGGRVVKGLADRRQREWNVCRFGLGALK